MLPDNPSATIEFTLLTHMQNTVGDQLTVSNILLTIINVIK